MTTPKKKLLALLRTLFQTDRSDLDFGIYRIMNRKRDEIDRFLEEELLDLATPEMSGYGQSDMADLQRELAEALKTARDFDVPDPENAPPVREIRAKLEKGADVTRAIDEIYSHMHTFFSRYYDGGDFISQRRQSAGTYLLPHRGEEILLHWANADQHYVKSGELFRDYSFLVGEDGNRRVRFEIVAADTEKDDIKAANGQDRVFVLDTGKSTARKGDTLTVRFRYARKSEIPGGTITQKRVNEETAAAMLGSRGLGDWLPLLREKSPTANNPDRTVLEKHIDIFTGRDTQDHFIHKNLRKFLETELDMYVKQEMLHLGDITPGKATALGLLTEKTAAFLRIARKLIRMLSQVEEFQRTLWLKRKFVVSTGYCVTLDRVPADLHPEIARCDAQWSEWESSGLLPPVRKADRIGHLQDAKCLVVDTRLFPGDFTERLLESVDDIDEFVDGLVVNSDNLQALRLLERKYRGRVTGVYIDPPYNTGASQIIYKNGYRHSSWMTLMADRLEGAKPFLGETGVLCAMIDDLEQPYLAILMRQLFEDHDIRTVVVEHNRRGRSMGNFAATHEYALWAIPAGRDVITRDEERGETGDSHRNLRRTGNNSLRTDSPTMFYGIHVNPNTLEILGVTKSLPRDKAIPVGEDQDDKVTIWPVEEDGTERNWYYARKSLMEHAKNGQVWAAHGNGKIQVRYLVSGGPPRRKTVWYGAKYDASTHGTELLNEMVGKRRFDFPKSIHAVEESLCTMSDSQDALFLDFFAGSGTTGHAAINLNRRDGGRRKYILVEMGRHCDQVLLPRLKKAVVAAKWKSGKPDTRNGIVPKAVSHCIKHIRLESYEDTLNNLIPQPRTGQQQSLLDSNKGFREEYLLGYFLDFELRGSPSLLDTSSFSDPAGYRLDISDDGANSAKPTPVDLVETFNLLLGMRVRRVSVRDGLRLVAGHGPGGESILVIWRKLPEHGDDALARVLDTPPEREGEEILGREYDLVYVNGDHSLGDRNGRLRMIEPEFRRLMFEGAGPGERP